MNNSFQELVEEHTALSREMWWIIGIATGLVALLAARISISVMGFLVTARGGPALNDLILDRVMRGDVLWLHLLAIVLLSSICILLLVLYPRSAPFLLWSCALVFFFRALCLPLTEFGMYADAVKIKGSSLTFGGDLFFSGHVAIASVLVYVLWKNVAARIALLLLLVAIIAILIKGHLHYSIDIIAAPFFAYGACNIIRVSFPKFADF